jgi:hypothetical protein
MQIAPSAQHNNAARLAVADKNQVATNQGKSRQQHIDLTYDNELFKKLLQPVSSALFICPQLPSTATIQDTAVGYLSTTQTMKNNMQQLCSELQQLIGDQQWSAQLYLPEMGEVNILIKQAVRSELNIILTFNPSIIAMVKPHREYCRQTLTRRLNKKIRLHFRQPDEKSQETD